MEPRIAIFEGVWEATTTGVEASGKVGALVAFGYTEALAMIEATGALLSDWEASVFIIASAGAATYESVFTSFWS